MTDPILALPLLAGFLITLFIIPFWIRKARQIRLVWNDMNKISSEKVAGSGGIVVILGFLVAVFVFIAYRVFVLQNADFLIEILSLLLVVSLLAGIGLIDDLLGWQHGGLSKRSRLIMVILASIPLMAINAGRHIIHLPFAGTVDLGLVYPLVLIPLGIVGATTTYNFLAGFNGLEAGQGIILVSALAIVSYFTGNSWLAIIAFCMVLALLAFLCYNFSPAKVFPGDSLTYALGGLIAAMAILGNFERIALFFFIPYILEVILKSRGGLLKWSFGRPQKDGSLALRYPKIYGLTHLSIWALQKTGIKPTEKRVVYLIWGFQILVILLGFLIFREGIFG